MNWKLYLIIFCLSFLQSQAFPTTFLETQEFMPIEKAEKKYGAQIFKPEVFKMGNAELRAKMATSIIRSNYYIGKSIETVRSELGSSTGYFWNGHIPAYLIEESQTNNQPLWQLVFLIDSKGMVNEVKIHRNGFFKK